MDFLLQPLDFANQQLVLFAVNNNPDAAAAGGGSHWSLLAYSAWDGCARHYDSAGGMNSSAARSLWAAVKPPAGVFSECACPQQQNSWDCGMFVLAEAHVLCRRFAEAGPSRMAFELGAGDVDQGAVARLRRELYQLIQQKAGQQQQQQKPGEQQRQQVQQGGRAGAS